MDRIYIKWHSRIYPVINKSIKSSRQSGSDFIVVRQKSGIGSISLKMKEKNDG